MKKPRADWQCIWPWLTGIIAMAVYLPALSNGFISWDDNYYVLNNPYLRVSGLGQFVSVFSSYYMGNYHPLSMLSLSLTYMHSGTQAWAYILSNIGLHALASVLVYMLIHKIIKSPLPAFFGAVLFAVHPVHVESVAWVSERKDVLYGLFFFASLLAWLHYRFDNERKMYFTAVLFYILSLFSKGMAVSLPLVMVLIDWLGGRGFAQRKMWLGKTPFFVLSLVFGLVAVLAQKPPGRVTHEFPYSYAEQVLFAFYGLGAYFGKMLFPLNLSAFYPYPEKNAFLPIQFYILPLVVVLALLLVVYALISGKVPRKWKTTVFGLLFSVATLLMVLQFFPIGRTLMADRYLYVPLAGFSVVLAVFVRYCQGLRKKKRTLVYAVVIAYLAVLSYATMQRTLVWQDSRTFWTDVIEKHGNVPIAYASRAQYWADRGAYYKALEDVGRAVKLEPDTPLFLVQRATLRQDMGHMEAALADYSRALRLSPRHAEALTGRALVLGKLGQFGPALEDHRRAIAAEPRNARLYLNRGLTYGQMGRYAQAYQDYTKAIGLKPQNTPAYVNRGSALRKMGRMQEALNDFNRAAELSPGMPAIYYNRGNTYRDMGMPAQAEADYKKALRLNANFLEAYVNLGTLYLAQNRAGEALPLLNKALQLSPGQAQVLFFRGKAYISLKEKEKACADFRRSLQTGYPGAAAMIKRHCP